MNTAVTTEGTSITERSRPVPAIFRRVGAPARPSARTGAGAQSLSRAGFRRVEMDIANTAMHAPAGTASTAQSLGPGRKPRSAYSFRQPALV
jgi:hypothetical protein